MPIPCPNCDRLFARSGHLHRHIQTVHSCGKVFTCQVCDRQFSRSDSFRRHQRTYHSATGWAVQSANTKATTRRACRNCAKARTRCSGGEACERCRDKRLDCKYPHEGSQSSSVKESCPVQMDLEQSSYEIVSHTPPVPQSPVGAIAAEHASLEVRPEQAAVERSPPMIDPCDLSTTVSLPSTTQGNIEWLPVMNDAELLVRDNMSSDLALSIAFQRRLETGSEYSSCSFTSSSPRAIPKTAHRRRISNSRYLDGRGSRSSAQRPILSNDAKDGQELHSSEFEFRATQSNFQPSQQPPLLVSDPLYYTLVQEFQRLCLEDSSPPFRSGNFATQLYCSYCAELYHRHFAPHFPVIHSITWQDPDVPWLLALAVITVGASFNGTRGGMQEFAAFGEFLRRAVRKVFEEHTSIDPLPMMQITLLDYISRMAYGTTRAATSEFEQALHLYKKHYRPKPSNSNDISQPHLAWQYWIYQESHTRLIWYTWLAKAMQILSTDDEGILHVPQSDLLFPASEKLWTAPSAEAWSNIKERHSSPVTLRKAMQQLYIKNKLEALGSIDNHTLLVYVIIVHTNEVAQSIQRPLYGWKPFSAGDDEEESSGDDDQDFRTSELWLPANSEYSAWRNSACDCLDLLHWAAGSEIANARGFEHPGVLHLHLARVLLLCPYRRFISLASAIGTFEQDANYATPWPERLDPEIFKWLALDDHKGRLSLVHSGAIFWHVCRYSAGMYYEPFAIYVATLTICIYGLYVPRVRQTLIDTKAAAKHHEQDESSETSESDDEDELIPTTILLDRPCDDEIVQAFVRKGHLMTAEMSGAGDICRIDGCRFVLSEAIRLLSQSRYAALQPQAAGFAKVLEQNLRQLECHQELRI